MNKRVFDKAEKPQPITDAQIKQLVSFLNRSFRETADEFKTRTGQNSNVKGSVLHWYQVEFSYIIDRMQRDAFATVGQNNIEANELIAKLAAHQKGQPVPA